MGKRVLIIGLGVFGQSLVNDLKGKDVELIIADQYLSLIESFKNDVDLAVSLDSTDEYSLKKLNPQDIDIAIVTIEESFEANLLTSVLLKQLGVAKVISRAYKKIQKKILLKSGVDLIITPEEVVSYYLSRDIINDSTFVETNMKNLDNYRDLEDDAKENEL